MIGLVSPKTILTVDFQFSVIFTDPKSILVARTSSSSSKKKSQIAIVQTKFDQINNQKKKMGSINIDNMLVQTAMWSSHYHWENQQAWTNIWTQHGPWAPIFQFHFFNFGSPTMHIIVKTQLNALKELVPTIR